MLSLLDKSRFLSGTDLFAEAPEAAVTQIAGVTTEAAFAAGETLFREGERGDALYLIVQGQVRVRKSDVDVLTRGVGDCLGEMALIDEAPRSATVAALTDVVALRLTAYAFHQVVDHQASLLRGLQRVLTRKLRADLDTQLETLQAHARLDQDIRRAAEIQRSMLPPADLREEWVQITGVCQPATTVGGDYYDYFALSPDEVGILIADVTGHGFYSGLLVAMAKSCLMTQLPVDSKVEPVMTALNRMVCPTGPDWLLMSGCYMLLDRSALTLTYANAGHNAPCHYHRQTRHWSWLTPTTHPLGIFADARYPTTSGVWAPGDTMVAYSDGIVEAENPQGELFGESRLQQALDAAIEHEPVRLTYDVLEQLQTFCDGAPPQDDVTLVVIRL